MADPLFYPKLRWPLDISLEAAGDQEVLVLQCPLGLVDQPLVLVSATAPIIGTFDGTQSVIDIAERFKEYGIKQELIRDLVLLLDKNLFLASPRFFEAEKQVKESFLAAPLRPPAFAGLVYPKENAAVASLVDGYLANKATLDHTSLVGLVAPHIDYRRGGAAYGYAYNALNDLHFDRYIVIGTSHQYSDQLFHLTAKDFETPLGICQTDKQFVDRLSKQYGPIRSFQDEMLHKKEHSLELQLPFLTRIKRDPVIIPILVGGFGRMVASGRLPNNFPEYEEFVLALADSIEGAKKQGQTFCIIAGVDMAHVGQSFGDEKPLSKEFVQEVRDRDALYIKALEEMDHEKLFSHIAEDNDRRRMCGFPTMYTVLDLFKRLGGSYRGKLLAYDQAIDYERESAVTFSGMGIYRA